MVSGSASIDLVGLLTVSGTFELTQFTIDSTIATFGAGATGLSLDLSVSGSGGPVGASGTLRLVRITNTAGLAWMAAEATDLNFSLEFGPLALVVTNGRLVLNQAPVGQTPIDWTDSVVVGELPIDFGDDLAGEITLLVSGSASIDLVGLLTVSGTFELTQFTIDSTIATFGAGATGLSLDLSVSGSGGPVGASGTLRLVRITNTAGLAWMAAEATDLNFSLEFGPLALAVTNGRLVLNQAPVGQTPIDWTDSVVVGELPIDLVTTLPVRSRCWCRGRRRSISSDCSPCRARSS